MKLRILDAAWDEVQSASEWYEVFGAMTMNSSAEIFELANSLPIAERAALAHQLILSLEDEPFDEDSEAEWVEELNRRAQRLERGETSLSDWSEALSRIRRSLEERKN